MKKSVWCRTFVVLNASFFAVFLQNVIGVKINELRIPEVTQFRKPVLLDCDYTLQEDDLDLVVKWFFNNVLIYQWIANLKPIDIGMFKGRLNLDYRASNDPNTEHRALYIKSPDPEMSGEYTCSVSSLASEDLKTKRMLVFVPEKNLELRQRYTDRDTMQLLCSVERVFPRPSINLYVGNSEINDSLVTVKDEKTFFDVKATANVSALVEPKEFSCQIDIPEANYTARTEAIYYPASAGCKQFTSGRIIILQGITILQTIRRLFTVF